MKRALIAAASLVLLATLLIARGRGNIVRHYYDDGTFKEILASEGSCRHHMRAHPLDQLQAGAARGWVSSAPDLCN